jgi:quercetin dioxygenase-like cupin family protein
MTCAHLTRRLARSTCALAASACVLLALAVAAQARIADTPQPVVHNSPAPTVVRETVLQPANGGPDTITLLLIGIGAAAALLGAGYLGARLAIRGRTHGGQASGTMRTGAMLTLTAVIALAAVGTAIATMPSGIAVTTFVRAPLAANKPNGGVKASADNVQLHTKGATDVAIQTITSPPGGSSGWHSHPGVVLVAVQSGTVTFYDQDCHTTQYGPGQAFIEAGDDAQLVRNNTTSNAVLYVTLIVPSSATSLRIDKPQPADCAAR